MSSYDLHYVQKTNWVNPSSFDIKYPNVEAKPPIGRTDEAADRSSRGKQDNPKSLKKDQLSFRYRRVEWDGPTFFLIDGGNGKLLLTDTLWKAVSGREYVSFRKTHSDMLKQPDLF